MLQQSNVLETCILLLRNTAHICQYIYRPGYAFEANSSHVRVFSKPSYCVVLSILVLEVYSQAYTVHLVTGVYIPEVYDSPAMNSDCCRL